MNKSDLVAAIAEKAELSKKDAEKALTAFEDVVTEELMNNGKVQLVGFGTFDVSERAAREGRNPQTGAASIYKLFNSFCQGKLRIYFQKTGDIYQRSIQYRRYRRNAGGGSR